MKQTFIEAGALFALITSHTECCCRLGKVFRTLVLAIVGCSGFHRQITRRTCNCSLFRKHHKKPYWTECCTQFQSKLILFPWRVRSVLQIISQLRSRWRILSWLSLKYMSLSTGFFKITRCHQNHCIHFYKIHFQIWAKQLHKLMVGRNDQFNLCLNL